MNWLNGFWMLLAPLLAVPLLIHLLNRKFPRLIRFSSLERLKKTEQERSKWLKWRHILFTILRTLLLLLLLLVFLRPYLDPYGTMNEREAGRHILVILDHSLSMEYKPGARTLREEAIEQAELVFSKLKPGDRANFIVAGITPKVWFNEFTTQHSDLAAQLRKVKAGLGEADLNRANDRAAQLLLDVSGPVDIYYLSDFQRHTWANVSFDSFPSTARFYFLDVSPGELSNRALLDAVPVNATHLAGDLSEVEITLANYTGRPRTESVRIQMDGRPQPGLEVHIPAWSTQKKRVPLLMSSTGPRLCEISIEADALVHDNVRSVVMEVVDREEVLVVTDYPEEDRRGAFFLQMALNPYGSDRGSLAPTLLGTQGLGDFEMARANKLIFSGIRQLDARTCQNLADFLHFGGNLIYFLDGETDGENLQRLDEAMGTEVVPLQLTARQKADNLARGFQQIAVGNFDSPYLRIFKGEQRSKIALMTFSEYYHAAPTGAGEILLSYADGTPVLASCTHGRGTLLLCNFSIDELASNVARQRIFPAWIQDLMRVMSRENSLPSSYHPGETVVSRFWKDEVAQARVYDPDQNVVEANREINGPSVHLSFPLSTTGFYTIGREPALKAFAVNTVSVESDLRPMDKSRLPRRAGPEREAHMVESEEDLDSIRRGEELYHWFLLALLLLMLMELGFGAYVRHLQKPKSLTGEGTA